MLKQIYYLAAIAAMGSVFAFTNHNVSPKSMKPRPSGYKTLSKEAQIKRGKYLVMIMGCGDCHAPKKMTAQGPASDMDRFLSGHNSAIPLGNYDKNLVKNGEWVIFNGQNTAFVGPWGVSFASNLTPDETGIGSWSFEQFSKALRQGKYKGIDNTRPLLPPMPWQNYVNMTNNDMRAVFTYLKSLKPVSNVVPSAIPPAP